jgi:tetratricopeptide (TPR) repeat protein
MELDFLMALGPCLIATQGPAGGEAVARFARARELCEAFGDPPEYLQVMFWLTTASVMRGELPLAQQTIAALLDRAERRDDRPALLNAIRGKAMILMFMGQLVDARQTIERAFDLFNDSDEEDRLAARAAGQDAGVADLALMSWTLWLLGQPDSALKCIHAALQRADEIGHAHTQAYARYYACVLCAMHGQPEVAITHAERCIEISDAHGFRQWLGLARSIKGICAALMDTSSESLEDVKTAMEEYRRAGYQLGITALYILLCLVLLLRDELDAALEIVERGLSTVEANSERIFEAELYRLKASILQRSGSAHASGRADTLLQQALRVAREQQAKSLELRVAYDLAQRWAHQGQCKEASDVLAPICDWFTEGADTRELIDARALLAKL